MMNVIKSIEPLSMPFRTLDPFLFCVYHKDMYGPGDEKMQAPRRGNGADFDASSPYRMYHGDRIPGFPQHPHRGFETITATMTGIIDHTDSMGNAGRYGHGDLQWMTAGAGVVHGEMFPLLNRDRPNPTKFFQIWLNLPKKSKFATPAFKMHWAEDIPVWQRDGAKVTIWAGEEVDGTPAYTPDPAVCTPTDSPSGASSGNKTALPPPPDSWASNPASSVGIWHIELQPGGSFILPAASASASPAAAPVNRMAYFIEGEGLSISGQALQSKSAATLHSDIPAHFTNTGTTTSEVLVLQGRPIGESVAQQGPFVMNTARELQQAYADYRSTQFGGWPWPEEAMVFPREKGRFALQGGVEMVPPVL